MFEGVAVVVELAEMYLRYYTVARVQLRYLLIYSESKKLVAGTSFSLVYLENYLLFSFCRFLSMVRPGDRRTSRMDEEGRLICRGTQLPCRAGVRLNVCRGSRGFMLSTNLLGLRGWDTHICYFLLLVEIIFTFLPVVHGTPLCAKRGSCLGMADVFCYKISYCRHVVK